VIVPDFISPIVGYRVWHWDAGGLRSLNGEPWLPGQPMEARCKVSGDGTLVGRIVKPAHGDHHAPQADCTCGIYAAKSIGHLRNTGYARFGITGEVCLWGVVVEHEQGWRAQLAYPKTLVLPLVTLPVSTSLLESRLQTLTAFNCDILVAGREGNVPLWSKGRGYNVAGLDMIVQRYKGWYAVRRQERQVKRGDRVAVLDRGIAVVEHVDAKQVHAVLWNNTVMRIGRKEIVWDGGNARWEAKLSAVFQRASLATSFVSHFRVPSPSPTERPRLVGV